MLGVMSAPPHPSEDPFPTLQSRAQALISATKLRRNAELLSQHAGVPLIAPVKANAYGHGLSTVAGILQSSPHVWGFAVAQPREAAELAALGTSKPVLILTPTFAGEMAALVALGVRLSVGTQAEVDALPAGAKVHLKVETGMNRTGARPAQALELARQLAARGQLEGVFTHFAQADEPPPRFEATYHQLELFQEVVGTLRAEGLDFLAHCANGGGVLSLGKIAGMQLARPGLALYGYALGHLHGVLPLAHPLRLRARVGLVHTVPAGERVSYGGLYTAAQEREVATVQFGYADGYPRAATLHAQAVVRGQRRPVLGRVCMDQLMVDVTGLGVQIGDWIDLIDGELVTTSDLAQWGELIEYELLTGLGSRVERLAE